MQFCPKCGSILIMKQKNFGCSRCSYSTKEEINMVIKEDHDEKIGITIIDKDQEATINPVTNFDCPKCKKGKRAYFWTQQMRSGDEPESRFYKCIKCECVTRIDS